MSARYRIRHRTGFVYPGDVVASYNEARMQPAAIDGQFVVESRVEIAPVGSVTSFLDYWGTRVTAFDILQPHRELALTATSLVEVWPLAVPAGVADWASLAAAAAELTITVEQLEQTKRTEPPAELVEQAAEIAAHHLGPSAAARAICVAVGDAIEYVPGATEVHTAAADAWDQHKGVCQDIAHLALGALRSVGIPARYVSGYLHPSDPAPVGETVQGESHAWVEWFNGHGWVGFDPTNGAEVADRHVVVGRGRDYDDVPPLRGVYAGPGKSTLFVAVEITREA